MLDLLFKNARITDGTGAPAWQGELGVAGGKIKTIAPHIDEEAARVVDCGGKVLCPGFIDSHAHSDLMIMTDPACAAKLRQGVTTEVAGQCGLTIAPVSADHYDTRNAASMVNPFTKGNRRQFTSTERWYEFMRNTPMGTNQLCLIGQGTIRETVKGYEEGPATPAELEEMKALVREAMEAGALGMSTGLAYSPGNFTSQEEVIELCKVVGEYGGLYASHMRNQANNMVQCVADTIDVARQTGCRACVSHIKCIGRPNWGHMKQAIQLLRDARAEGLDVWCDVYPYVAGSTTLTVTLPPSLLEGGRDHLVERLKKPEVQAYIKEQFAHPTEHWENAVGTNGFDSFLVAMAPATPEAMGKRISEYAEELGMDPFDTYIKLLIDNDGAVATVNFVMSEDDLLEAVSTDFCLIGSDGTYRAGDKIAHPRAIGTFPRFLGRYARDQGLFSMEQAVAKITGQCAGCYGLENCKGFLKEGYDADLVVFDPEQIIDTADFVNTLSHNKGIQMVVVGGRIAVENDELTDVRSGVWLRANNKKK